MKKIPLSLLTAAPWCVLFGALPISLPSVGAQQPTAAFPVANTAGTADPASTPASSNDAPARVENPPPPAPVDPNAPIETEILASKGATFASQERIAVFEGDVRVNDPRFQLACDKLTVFLSKAKDDGSKPGADAAAKGTGDQSSQAGGIDHARAEGHVIIIQKRAAEKAGEEVKVSMGRAEVADFDNKTGDMVLHGMPIVEQNGNRHIALSPSTVMTLHKNNSMNSVGPTRTIFISKGGQSGFDVPGASSSPGAKPAGSGKPKKGGSAPRG